MTSSTDARAPLPRDIRPETGDVTFTMLPLASIELPVELRDDAAAPQPFPYGDILPLIVARRPGNTYIVIDGCKRLERHRQCGRETCACGVLGGSPDPGDLALLRILLNSGRSLSLAEKVLFTAWLRAHLPPGESSIHLDRLGIAPGERHEIEQLAACDREILAIVDKGLVAGSLAPCLSTYEGDDRRALIGLLGELAFSRQAQRELVGWLGDIMERDRVPAHEVLETGEIGRIRAESATNGPQKIQKIRNALHAKRFPEYDEALRQWKRDAARVNPDPSHVNLVPSEFLEKDRLEVRLSLQSGKQARALLTRLAEVDESDWEGLIGPGRRH